MNTYQLENEFLRVQAIDYGARITSIYLKEKGIDVAVGCDRPEDYLLDAGANFGAAIGRYANRISGARFSLNGKEYRLPQNDGENCLHGGRGFAFRYFDCAKTAPDRLSCTYTAADMEEGFPGEMKVRIEYILDGASLRIRYHASCNQDTVCNLTNHSYFNLNGGGTVLDHELQIDADFYQPIGTDGVSSQAPAPVEGTPFDFRSTATVGARIDKDHPQLTAGTGYDHNFVLNGTGFRTVATLSSQQSGIRMHVVTDLPGIQFYSGNFMNSPAPLLRGGRPQRPREGLCLETQLFPDSPNHPEYPDCVLQKNENFFSETAYVFEIFR